jgi:UDP-N-acetylmuramyl tripeptide synthase
LSKKLGDIAAGFYGDAIRDVCKVIGITGTNGKTYLLTLVGASMAGK